MFHVELRRFPYVARGFNLSEQELDARIVLPFVRGVAIEFDDRSWPSDKTRLTIYEGPPVASEDRGLGRGWSLVTRDGEDVTTNVLGVASARVREASPEGAVPGLKQELIAAAAESSDGISPRDAVTLAAGRRSGQRASEALAIAEQAVWELLHEGGLMLWDARSGEPVAPEEWQSLVLAWETWREEGGLRLSAAE